MYASGFCPTDAAGNKLPCPQGYGAIIDCFAIHIFELRQYRMQLFYIFTYDGNNHALLGFYNAIILVMETGFAVTAFLALILNLVLLEDVDDEVVEITANTIGEKKDEQEWERIRRPSTIRAIRKSQEQGRDSVDMESADGIAVDKLPPVKEQ